MRTFYKIGPFLLDPEVQALTHEGAAVSLGTRAVAVLCTLVSHANEYVEKSAILDSAWPGLVVAEANLAVQISAIRHALARAPGGEGWIETLARRGYRFVGPVTEIAGRSPPRAAADRKRTNLPEVLTSFVGRERELAEIKQLLPGTRLLTLSGTGGIGKTRLAQQAAAEVLDAYRDGVWFIDLAPLRDPALVPSALAQVLQIKELVGKDLVTVLCNHLRARETLLILDNCEQVLDACAHLIETLVRETAHVSLIATSREPLHVPCEHAYPLGTLPLPDPKGDVQSIARSDAVQLFVERARQYRPRFDLREQRARAVAAICVRLDGIPLALELAAVRVAMLPVEQIVRLLDQRFRLLTSGDRELPRHQTLRAMIDWSYELLDEVERALFARLSVFAGGWTLAAAEAVCGGDPIAKNEVVYVLIGLIEQSLVIADEDGDRYRLLETVRIYAKEKLVASGSAAAVQQRHRDYYLSLVEEADSKLTGAEQEEWLQRLDREHDNLRSALESCIENGNSGPGQRFCGSLQRFWWIRGYFSEGRGWCARVLGQTSAKAPTLERAKALNTAGTLAYIQGDYAAAQTLNSECLAIRRGLGDRKGIAASLNNLGLVACDQGDYTAARVLYEESVAIKRELQDRSGIANSLNNLGNVAYEQGELARAQAWYEESLMIARELGDREGVARVLGNLGNVALYQRDLSSARRLHEESLAIKREMGHRQRIGGSLISLGNLASDQGDLDSARALYHEAVTIARELGDRLGIANALVGLATVVAGVGIPLRAARIWGAGDRLRSEIGSPVPPKDRPEYDRRVAAARAASGDDAAFTHAWEEGFALTLEQAIELALEQTPGQR